MDRLAYNADVVAFQNGPSAKPAISTTGKGVGLKSQCEPLAEVVVAKAEVGLSAQVFTRICTSLGGVFYDRRLDVPKMLLVRKGAQLRNLPHLLPAKGKAASSSTATSFKGFTLNYEEQDKNKDHWNGNHS